MFGCRKCSRKGFEGESSQEDDGRVMNVGGRGLQSSERRETSEPVDCSVEPPQPAENQSK